MRRFGSLLALAATSLAIPQVASADDPKLAPQLAAIRSLIGTWSGKGTLMSEGKTHPITMTYECAESSGGAGVKCKAAIDGIPGFAYVFDDLWGYSAQDGLTHWYTVTNAGEVHDHRGHFDIGGGLLQIEIPVEGKLFSEVVTFKRNGKALMLSWTTTSGGTVHEKGELTLNPKIK